MDIQTLGLILGIISSLIAIFNFITGISSIQDIKNKNSNQHDDKSYESSPDTTEPIKTTSTPKPPRQSSSYVSQQKKSSDEYPSSNNKTITRFVLAGVFAIGAVIAFMLGSSAMKTYSINLAKQIAVSNVIDSTTPASFVLTNQSTSSICLVGWVEAVDETSGYPDTSRIRRWWNDNTESDLINGTCIPMNSGESLYFNSSYGDIVFNEISDAKIKIKTIRVAAGSEEYVVVYSK